MKRKWFARFSHGGRRHFLGRFAEERDAVDAVRAAREAAGENRLEEHLTELRARSRTGTSGTPGVSWRAASSKWMASFYHGGRRNYRVFII